MSCYFVILDNLNPYCGCDVIYFFQHNLATSRCGVGALVGGLGLGFSIVAGTLGKAFLPKVALSLKSAVAPE